MAHVAEWKFKEVEDLTKIIKDNSVIGIAEIGSIPAPQMQQMRENLREKMVIRSSKNTLIFRAIDDSEKNVKDITALKFFLPSPKISVFCKIAKNRVNTNTKGNKTSVNPQFSNV